MKKIPDLPNESRNGLRKTSEEWAVFLDHAHNVIRAIREREGSWYVRTLISRWLEDMDDEESDTTT